MNKDFAASVRARLLDIAEAEGSNFTPLSDVVARIRSALEAAIGLAERTPKT